VCDVRAKGKDKKDPRKQDCARRTKMGKEHRQGGGRKYKTQGEIFGTTPPKPVLEAKSRKQKTQGEIFGTTPAKVNIGAKAVAQESAVEAPPVTRLAKVKAKLGKKRAKQATAEEAVGEAAKPKKTMLEVRAEKKKTKAEQRAQALTEEQHRALYGAKERILLVGEGNFSFAKALCEHVGDGSEVFSTAFDSEATLASKYPDVADIRKEIETKYKSTTLVGVDATKLHKIEEFQGAFKKIVFNFPHIGGGEADVDKSVLKHRKLLADFFQSAVQCLSDERGAAIHVALKDGEPYKSWKIRQTGIASLPEDFDLLTAIPFVSSAWPGYAHRRTQGFDARVSKADSEELAKGAKIFIFGRRKVKIEQKVPDRKTIMKS